MMLKKFRTNSPISSGMYYSCLSKRPAKVAMDWQAMYRVFNPEVKELDVPFLTSSYTGNVLGPITYQERQHLHAVLSSNLLKQMQMDRTAVYPADAAFKEKSDTLTKVLNEEMDNLDKAFEPLYVQDTYKHKCEETGCTTFGEQKICPKNGKTLVTGQKNPNLMKFLTKRYTMQKGQLVVDPFMGTGKSLFVYLCSQNVPLIGYSLTVF